MGGLDFFDDDDDVDEWRIPLWNEIWDVELFLQQAGGPDHIWKRIILKNNLYILHIYHKTLILI